MLFSCNKGKVLAQAGGTEHANAERSVGKDLGAALVHQLTAYYHKKGKLHLRDKQGCHQQDTRNDPSPSVGKSKLITVNVTNVTCGGCYHFRWSETSLGSL